MVIEWRLQQRIVQDFGTAADEVLQQVSAAALDVDGAYVHRVQAAAVLAARGDRQRLVDALQDARTNWRGLVAAAGLGGEDWPAVLDRVLGPDLPLPPSLPGSWEYYTSVEDREDDEREVLAEVGPGHVLYGQPITALAWARYDDVLVAIGADFAPFAVVHLTYGLRPQQPPWPTTIVLTAPAEHALRELASQQMTLADADEPDTADLFFGPAPKPYAAPAETAGSDTAAEKSHPV